MNIFTLLLGICIGIFLGTFIGLALYVHKISVLTNFPFRYLFVDTLLVLFASVKSVESEDNKMAIKRCTCQHEAQDKLHGKGRRVHNETASGWRCTVCGTEKEGKGRDSD